MLSNAGSIRYRDGRQIKARSAFRGGAIGVNLDNPRSAQRERITTAASRSAQPRHRVVILELRDQRRHRKRRGSRGGRRTCDNTVDYTNRDVIQRGFCRLTQERGIASPYDELAIVYRTAVVLNTIAAKIRQSQDTPWV